MRHQKLYTINCRVHRIIFIHYDHNILSIFILFVHWKSKLFFLTIIPLYWLLIELKVDFFLSLNINQLIFLSCCYDVRIFWRIHRLFNIQAHSLCLVPLHSSTVSKDIFFTMYHVVLHLPPIYGFSRILWYIIEYISWNYLLTSVKIRFFNWGWKIVLSNYRQQLGCLTFKISMSIGDYKPSDNRYTRMHVKAIKT